MILKNRIMNRRYRNEEWFPIVNNDGKVTVKLRGVSVTTAKAFFCILLYIFIYLTVQENCSCRSDRCQKIYSPENGIRRSAVMLVPRESVTAALLRETREELGLNGFTPQFVGSYIWESPREREMVNSFSTVTRSVPIINRDEIDEGRFWSLQEIRDNLGKEIFTPNFEHEFN